MDIKARFYDKALNQNKSTIWLFIAFEYLTIGEYVIFFLRFFPEQLQ